MNGLELGRVGVWLLKAEPDQWLQALIRHVQASQNLRPGLTASVELRVTPSRPSRSLLALLSRDRRAQGGIGDVRVRFHPQGTDVHDPLGPECRNRTELPPH